MAVVGFWPVYGNLKATLDYADNPDKTTAREYLDDDLYAALRYTENDNKTDRKMYVGGINCSKQNAYAEMIAVQRRFGLRGTIVGFHGIQSFREGEITPEEAFEIGKETARRMWGDRYQVLVTVHLNTDNLHCHFVVTPVSFKDGLKFRNQIGDHKELRKISDAICREHGLSVLENSNFYGGKSKGAYWYEKRGGMSHREMLKRDIEEALKYSKTDKDVYNRLRSLGYTLKRTEDKYNHLTVTAPGWKRPIRMDSLGYTEEYMNSVIDKHRETPNFYWIQYDNPVYRPKKFPLEQEMKRLEFTIEHSKDITTIFIDLVFLIIIQTFELLKATADVMLLSSDLRHEEKNLKQFISDYRFLQDNNIRTIPELQNCITETQTQIADLEAQRNKLSNKIRRPKSPEEQSENKERRKAVTTEITPLRKKLKQAEKIFEKSPHLYELLKTEHDLEIKARNKMKDRSR